MVMYQFNIKYSQDHYKYTKYHNKMSINISVPLLHEYVGNNSELLCIAFTFLDFMTKQAATRTCWWPPRLFCCWIPIWTTLLSVAVTLANAAKSGMFASNFISWFVPLICWPTTLIFLPWHSLWEIIKFHIIYIFCFCFLCMTQTHSILHLTYF